MKQASGSIRLTESAALLPQIEIGLPATPLQIGQALQDFQLRLSDDPDFRVAPSHLSDRLILEQIARAR